MLSRVMQYPNTMGNNPNMPMLTFENSGGINRASSHTSMFGNHHGTTPQVLVTPSTHPVLAMSPGPNSIHADDIVFTLNDLTWIGASKSAQAHYYGRTETPVATLCKLNRLILAAARWDEANHIAEMAACATARIVGGRREEIEGFRPGYPVESLPESMGFWQSPRMVMEWAAPMGVANEPYEQPGSHNSPACMFVPVQVARRMVTKHIFRSVSSKCSEWTAQSAMHLALQYSIEEVQLSANGPLYPLVVVSGLLMDDSRIMRQIRSLQTQEGRDDPDNDCGRATPLIMISDPDGTYHALDESVKAYQMNPVGNTQTTEFVHFGRVLHTASAHPTATETLRALIKKQSYDVCTRIDINLGCR
jgi:hypothetical protein